MDTNAISINKKLLSFEYAEPYMSNYQTINVTTQEARSIVEWIESQESNRQQNTTMLDNYNRYTSTFMLYCGMYYMRNAVNGDDDYDTATDCFQIAAYSLDKANKMHALYELLKCLDRIQYYRSDTNCEKEMENVFRTLLDDFNHTASIVFMELRRLMGILQLKNTTTCPIYKKNVYDIMAKDEYYFYNIYLENAAVRDNNIGAMVFLSDICYAKNRVSKSMEYINKALELNCHPEVMIWAAKFYEADEKYTDAYRIYKRMLSNSSRIHYATAAAAAANNVIIIWYHAATTQRKSFYTINLGTRYLKSTDVYTYSRKSSSNFLTEYDCCFFCFDVLLLLSLLSYSWKADPAFFNNEFI